MRKIILSLLIFTSISCKSQTIFPIYQIGSGDKKNNFYYKDTENFQDQYVGSWLFNDGTTYLKVKFIKKLRFLETRPGVTFYRDYLIGEYEYKVNGVTVVNTLNNINNNHSDIHKYNMYSLMRYKINQFPECVGCDVTKRLVMVFQELPSRNPDWAAGAHFIIRRVMEGGVEKLRVQFIMTDPASGIPAGLGDDYQGFSLPFGEYTLVRE
ncbi:hypothetical protein FSS13T_16280 [Flavobacterium saliperosum S13]|uniref:DUF6705 domain-containing protein n=2 Tax=Flavobacterium saliperosum TaxID=329186 RepID=A0A1G4VHF4_9FLAO|nr:DUF6705 family protein [Flavobacterium saliperosum]ESU25395.1 hypothetical protein FSS13T_16280 [Flavobacterium saliperosum S13]SCX06836.1 hypothetical protein SAMN02927925_01068 [Flavobacterium saliperosum]